MLRLKKRPEILDVAAGALIRLCFVARPPPRGFSAADARLLPACHFAIFGTNAHAINSSTTHIPDHLASRLLLALFPQAPQKFVGVDGGVVGRGKSISS